MILYICVLVALIALAFIMTFCGLYSNAVASIFGAIAVTAPIIIYFLLKDDTL